MKRIILILVLATRVLLLSTKKQRNLLYVVDWPPKSREYIDSPESHDISEYENVSLYVEADIFLHCFWIPAQSKLDKTAPKKSVLMFGGNCGNIGDYLNSAAIFTKFLNVNVFLVSYRGFGLSEGSFEPNEDGLRLDALAAFRYLAKKSPLPIVVHGYSLGSAVAIALVSDLAIEAAKRIPKAQVLWERVGGLIVESTFLSIPKLLPHISKVLWLFAWMCADTWDSESRLKKLVEMHTTFSRYHLRTDFPILFMAGRLDELTALSQMQELYSIIENVLPKTKFVTFDLGTHTNMRQQVNYIKEVMWALR